MPQHQFARCPNAGFTLIELAITVAITGLVIGGIWFAAANVFESNRVRDASRQLVYISEKMRTLVGQRGVPTSASNPALTLALCNLGVFPAEMIRTCTVGGTLNLTHPWDAQVTIEAATSSSRYYVRYEAMPESSCINLAVKSSVNADDIGMVAINTAAGTSTANQPVSVADADTLCATSGYMRFEMRLDYN
jgi:prepilin-type N-terminal cleavage/methylation domain-containing protein